MQNAMRDEFRISRLSPKLGIFLRGIIVEPSEHHGCPGSILVGVHVHATRRCGFLMLLYSFWASIFEGEHSIEPRELRLT